MIKLKKTTLFQSKCNKVKKILNYDLSQGRLILKSIIRLYATESFVHEHNNLKNTWVDATRIFNCSRFLPL